MTALILTLVWFVTIGIAGHKVLRTRPDGSVLERFAFYYLLGLALNGIALFTLGVLGIPLGAGAFLAVFTVGLLIVVTLSKRVAATPGPRYPLLPTIVLFIPFIALAADAMWVPLRDYDGRAFWVLKAKAIVHEERIDGPFFQGQTSVNLHSEYPLLMPLNAATVMKIIGDPDDRRIRWMYLLAGFALCLVVRAQIRDHFGARAGAWCAAVLPWLPQISTELEGGAMSAFSDIPLAAFIAAAFATVLRRAEGWERLTGIWLAGMVLMKNEGTMIAAVIAVIAMVLEFRGEGRRIRFLFPLIVPPLFAAALLAIWRSRIPFEHGKDYGRLIQDLPSRWPGFFDAAGALLAHAVDWNRWGAFWIVVLIATAITLIWRRSAESVAAVTLIAGILIPYIVAYTVTDWKLGELAGKSADRLLTHVLGPAIFIIAAVGWTKTPSKPRAELLDLEKGVVITPADVAALERAKKLDHLSPEEYLRFLLTFSASHPPGREIPPR